MDQQLQVEGRQAPSPGQGVGPRLLIQVGTEIEGTETERLFFHRFRRAAELGLNVHVATAWPSRFWNATLPRLCHHDTPTRHAAIALGATFQLYRLPPESRSRELEIFSLQQYTKAMSELKYLDARSDADRVVTTLICCLAFFVIESLRGNTRVALTHLAGGNSIIGTFPPEKIAFLNNPKMKVTNEGEAISEFDMEYLLMQFDSLSMSGGMVVEDFDLTMTNRLYGARKLDPTMPDSLDTLRDVHISVMGQCRDVFSFAWEIKSHQRGVRPFDVEPWSQPFLYAQYKVLMKRGAKLKRLLLEFEKRPDFPKHATPEYYSFYTDRLHFACQDLTSSIMPELPDIRPTPDTMQKFQDIMSLILVVRQGISLADVQEQNGRLFTLDGGIMQPLYLIACCCPDRALRRRALHLLRTWPRQEHLWDFSTVKKLIGSAGSIQASPDSQSFQLFRGVPTLYERVVELQRAMADEKATEPGRK